MSHYFPGSTIYAPSSYIQTDMPEPTGKTQVRHHETWCLMRAYTLFPYYSEIFIFSIPFQGYFYPDCSKLCENGTVEWPDSSGFCRCDPCYSGDRCQLECSGNGECSDGVCNCTSLAGNYTSYSIRLPTIWHSD